MIRIKKLNKTDEWYEEQPEWGTDASTKKAKEMTPKETYSEEVSQKELDDLEKFADRLLNKFDVDIEFTRHFRDRMNDKRNKPAITVDELKKLFQKMADNKGRKIKKNANTEAILKDMQSDLNLPIVINWKNGEFEVVNKTIMRKKAFKSPDKELRYESCCEDCDDHFDHTISESEFQGKKVKLNDPFRLPSGSSKKFGVYVKNEKGNVVKVTFGDPNMSIKRDSDERRKSFRARHNCADPGPKTKARYWSCYQWRASAKVDETIDEEPLNVTGPATATDKPVVRKKKFADFVRRDGKIS